MRGFPKATHTSSTSVFGFNHSHYDTPTRGTTTPVVPNILFGRSFADELLSVLLHDEMALVTHISKCIVRLLMTLNYDY